jgi:hypothetical protein
MCPVSGVRYTKSETRGEQHMSVPTKKNLIIFWQDGPRSGYGDLIPRSWLVEGAPQERGDHYVLSPANKQNKARYSLTIKDDIVLLDYEKHKAFKRKERQLRWSD